VKSGRADATLNDKLSFLQMQKQNPNLGLKIAATASDAVPSGFMFRKDETDLVTAVNTALQGMFNDGTYANISKKYFGAVVLPNGSTKG
jgi:L-cystine transport system substrate-binding protein